MPDLSIITPEIFNYSNGEINGYWIETGSESIGKSVFIQKGIKYLEINFPGCAAGDHYKYHKDTLEIMDQMAASFKFTDLTEEGTFCGGIAGIICPSGYECLYEGNYPDAGGKCVKK